MNTHATRTGLALVLALGSPLVLAATANRAAAVAVPLARQGDPSPDGNGTFGLYSSFGEPCLNDSSEVAFSTRLSGSAAGTADDEVLLRAKSGSPTAVMVREGEALPLGGTFASGIHFVTRQYAMNNEGRVAFSSGLNGTPGGTGDNAGVFSSEGPGTMIQHARKGASAPGIGGTFTYFYPPQINNQIPAGVSFFASNGGVGPGAIYVASATSLTLLAYGSQPMPDGNGSIRNFWDSEPPALKPNANEVAVWAHLWSSGGTLDDDGVLRARAAGISIVARGGNAAPGGGTYNDPFGPVINILGNCAFFANRYPVPSAGEGIYLAGGTILGGARIVNRGQAAPDHNGTFDGFSHPSLSAGNLVAFRADLTGTAGGGFDDSGVYRGDPFVIIQVAHEDQAVPEGGGRFNSFGNVVGINAVGQVLFTANLRGTPGGSADDRGLYLWDEVDGLCKLLREGDVIEGQTVIAFSALTARDYGGYRCLNDAGQAVARVDFMFGGDGIYLFSCPDAASVEAPREAAPLALARLDVGPNPFGAEPLTLRYALPAGGGSVELRVHDVAGRLVRTLIDGPAAASGTLRWDGTAEGNRPLAAGVYFLRLDSPGGATAVRRVVRLEP